jgi:hypothetical protein
MDKKGILVLGTYRSGTSATTGVLHRLGFESNAIDLQLDNLAVNPTGSYRDKYLSGSLIINWEEYFALKGANEKWCSKHHSLYANNNIQEYIANFPADRESWLVWAHRPIENSIASYAFTSGLSTSAQDIYDLHIKTQAIYDAWGDNKIIVEFGELLGNTEQAIRTLCTKLNVSYVQDATDFIDVNHSSFGGA